MQWLCKARDSMHAAVVAFERFRCVVLSGRMRGRIESGTWELPKVPSVLCICWAVSRCTQWMPSFLLGFTKTFHHLHVILASRLPGELRGSGQNPRAAAPNPGLGLGAAGNG